MEKYNCKRCCMEFSEKRVLVKHLKRKVICLSIESEKTQEELLEELNKKEGLMCENCKKKYKNDQSLRVHLHRCKGLVENVKDKSIVDIEKRIKELQKELNGAIKKDTVINQVANTIDNSTTNNITNNIQNITVVINDIDSINGIDYILKDPRFTEKILKWVTDKNGLLKYMDEKYYNPKRPENRGIRKVDNENIELHMKGDWNKYDNKTALDNIINSLRIDWDTIIGRMKDNYYDDYESNKKDLLVFKREVSDPLEMELYITDDEDETKEKTKQLVCVDGNYELVDVKDKVLVKKEKKWNDTMLKIVK
jgi:hypothetical protein